MTKVINKQSTEPSRAHARVDCTQSSTQSGFINKPVCSQSTRIRARVEGQLYSSPSRFINKPSSHSTGARSRVREEGRRKIANEAAYFKAWRKARFGGDFDPVRMAVDEAVAAFSSHKPVDAQARDRQMWLKIANCIGLERFLDAFDQKQSEIRELAERGGRLWNPAASFKKLLNKRFPKGGAL